MPPSEKALGKRKAAAPKRLGYDDSDEDDPDPPDPPRTRQKPKQPPSSTSSGAGPSGAAPPLPRPSADFKWGADNTVRAAQLDALIEQMAKSSTMLNKVSQNYPLDEGKDKDDFEAACRVQRTTREMLVALSSVLKGIKPTTRKSPRAI